MKTPSTGIVVAGVAIVVLGILFGINRYYHLSKDDAAALGDVFNAVNSLFAGLAFLGLIWAILLQRAELRLQRKELQLTRREMKRQAEAQEESGKALDKQANTMLLTAYLDSLASLWNAHRGKEEVVSRIWASLAIEKIQDIVKDPFYKLNPENIRLDLGEAFVKWIDYSRNRVHDLKDHARAGHDISTSQTKELMDILCLLAQIPKESRTQELLLEALRNVVGLRMLVTPAEQVDRLKWIEENLYDVLKTLPTT